VIAAMNGPAAGVGLALACFADLRFAAAGAKFTTAHGKLNLPAEYGLSWLLPRMIGLARANELLLSSRVFLAEEALAVGLVNAVYPAEQVLDRTLDYARELARTVAPESLRQTRWQVYRDLHRDVAAAVTDSEALLEIMMRQDDYAEGVAAFLEKRAPRWVGDA
jgi:enoyl-CoA hydratase/carnithine racemase